MNPWKRAKEALAGDPVAQHQQFTGERMRRINGPGPAAQLRAPRPASPWSPAAFKSTRGQAIPEMQRYLQEMLPELEYQEGDPSDYMINFGGTPVDMRKINVPERK